MTFRILVQFLKENNNFLINSYDFRKRANLCNRILFLKTNQ